MTSIAAIRRMLAALLCAGLLGPALANATGEMLITPTPGTITTGILIPDSVLGGNHPHLVDCYDPDTTIASVLVALHGGSGDQIKFARNLGIATGLPITTKTVNWALLSAWHVAVCIPQGQALTGVYDPVYNPYSVDTRSSTNPDGIRTWNNHVMLSGTDDVQFLKDFRTYLLARYGAVGINCFGHSNGGMMCERMWYESPTTFSHYCSISGPASDYYVTHPTLPSPVRPFFVQDGGIDSVLDISGGPAGSGSHFYEMTWEQNPAQLSKADVAYNPAIPPYVFPEFWIGESYQTATRANAGGASIGSQISPSDGVVSSIVNGTETDWSYDSGSQVLEVIWNAEHQVRSHQLATGRRVFGDCMSFILAN